MRVIVCGAGIAGLAAANRLAAQGHDVVVLERAPGPRGQGYMIDFFGPGYDAIEAMGLLPALEEAGYRVTEAVLVDDHGRRRAGMNLRQFAEGALVSVMRPDLEQVLRAGLPVGVDLRYGAGVQSVTPADDGVRVELDDGTTLGGDLLIGADGIHSTVRRLLFGPESSYLRHLGFHTAAYTFDAPDIHAAFNGRFVLTDTIGSQFGFYGLRDGRVASFAVHRTTDPSLPADPRAAIRSSYRGLGWVVPKALELCPEPAEIYYDQVAQIVMPAWSKGRVVLLGDSASAVSLLAGQGASLAVAGAYVLADCLQRADTLEAGLTEYERVWRPEVEAKQRVGRSAARWFLPASKLQLVGRRLALHLLRLPLVRRLAPAAVAGKPITLIQTLQPSQS
ncbi:FAD-binding protein [Kribbella turkmenica]|uniref:FAD-binding protein n=1 Tax=Kribbella turkmenica TaxID=2530375 RepID=A0A4R4X9L9_9ACTN|nr:FAD-dependent oxidoreductase [Kribbella turkmenica]TDD27152.1 FAD-binding protein [Kribbella turkmenica]